MTFDEFVSLTSSEARWDGVTRLPWEEPSFSERMLREHLSQLHDGASRRLQLVEQHVRWMHSIVLHHRRHRVLDLGCGPGLYTQRLAELGHECVGVDLGPAAIAYARSHVGDRATNPRYMCGDFTVLPLDEEIDFAMMIHGEFNVLPRVEAAKLLRRIGDALAPDGHLLLEVHPLEAVKAMGWRGRAWLPSESGLFGDHPHVRLDESWWKAEAKDAITLNWVIDGETFTVERFGTATHGYSEEEYAQVLLEAGFSTCQLFPSLTGEASDTNYVVWLASKSLGT